MWSAILVVALLAQFDGPGGGVTPEECLSVGGGTLSGNLKLKDDIYISFGTTPISQIYSDGTDTYWLTQVTGSTAGVMIALGDSPPAPDDSVLHLWNGTVAGSCSGADMLCLESSSNAYAHLLAGNAGFAGFQFGDAAASVQASMLYGMSSNGTDAGQIRIAVAGNTRILDIGVGLMEHKQATTYTTTVGDLGLNPVGELTQNPATKITTTFDDRNGFAKVCTTSEEVLTFAAGAGDASKTTSGLIPDGATQIAVTAYVTTTGTTCTSADYGDGVDVDLYGDNIAVSAGSDVDPSDYTASLNYNTTAASEVTITGVGGNCVDMVVRVVAHYCTFTAPGS